MPDSNPLVLQAERLSQLRSSLVVIEYLCWRLRTGDCSSATFGHFLCKAVLRGDDDLSEHFPALDHAQTIDRPLERERAMDDGLHFALLDKIHQRLQIVVVEAVRTDDLYFEAPDVAQVFLRIVTGGCAAHQDLAAALHAPERGLPGIPTGEIDHDIHATLVAAALGLAILLRYPFREIGLLIVDHLIGAEFLKPPDLAGARRSGDDFRAEHLGKDHATGSDAAARTEHEHFVAGFDRLVRDQHAMRCTVGHRQCGCLLVSHSVRHPDQLVFGDKAFLREPAVHHLAHQPPLPVEWIDQHPLPGLPAIDAGPGLEDLASHVQSDDDGERHLDAGHAANRHDVVVIQGGRLHTDHHMPVGHPRIWEVRAVHELLGPAMLLTYDILPMRGPPQEM